MNAENIYPSDPAVMEPRFHPPCDIRIGNLAAVNTQATATAAAGVNGTRHVVTAFAFTIGFATGLAASTIGCHVIDGASGTGTYLWQETMAISTLGAFPMRIAMSGLNIPGSINTALTIEFSGSVSSGYESVNLTYHDIGGGGA